MARLTLSEQLTAANLRIEQLTEEAAETALAAAAAKQAYNALVADMSKLQREVSKLPELKEQVSELEKKLKSAESMKDYYYKEYSAKENEIEQIHDVLDGIDSAPERSVEKNGSTIRRSVIVRLAGLLFQQKVN